MALRLSTGFQNKMLGTASVSSILTGCKIAIYSGPQPNSANDAALGTLLATISLDGGATGLSWDAPSAGVLAKAVAETWQGTSVASGTAGWFRCYEATDVPANATTTLARFDGSVSTSSAQLNMSSTTIANGAVQTISTFTYTQPAS